MYHNRPITLVTDRNERFCFYEKDDFRIGGGAMGIVYKGWDVRNPERKVAIKQIHAIHSNNANIRQRAKYESSLRIDHPNVIKMIGYAEPTANRGALYIISEMLRGVTVDEYMLGVSSEMRLQRLADITCSILDGLQRLHTLPVPIFHRDIKPSNILVENSGNAVLMDLGIATSDGVSHGTLNGFAGTAAYTSPEQISSSRFGAVSARSDIYSLGLTFYALLTGVNPFADGVCSEVEILNRQVSMPLPDHVVIPRELKKVLLKATAKMPQDRYQTAEEFRSAIIKAMQPQTMIKDLLANDDMNILLIVISLVVTLFSIVLLVVKSLF